MPEYFLKKFRNSEYKKFNTLAEKFVKVVEDFEKKFHEEYDSPSPNGLNMDIDSDLLYYLYLSIIDFQRNALITKLGTDRYSKEINQSKIPECARKLINLKNGIKSGSANLDSVYAAMEDLLTAYVVCMKSVNKL
ncbi:MAG: hypothetical protein ACI4PR_04530 [Acutalibacteraceae bacterium]